MPSHPNESTTLTAEQAQRLAERFLDRVAGAVANGALSTAEATELHRRLRAAAAPDPATTADPAATNTAGRTPTRTPGRRSPGRISPGVTPSTPCDVQRYVALIVLRRWPPTRSTPPSDGPRAASVRRSPPSIPPC